MVPIHTAMLGREFARAAKKAVVCTIAGHHGFSLEIFGHTLRVQYHSRRATIDRDYEFLQRLASGSSCIFDVGANIGLTSILMAGSSHAQVYAFEASESACVMAHENISLNREASQISLFNVVVGRRCGEMQRFFWNHHSAGSSMMRGRDGHTLELLKSTISLDAFVLATGVVPDFIKIDVEGAETDVLSGAQSLLGQHRPLVFVELHSGDMTLPERVEAILPLLSQQGYRMTYLRTLEAIIESTQLRDRGRCHVLLTPEEAALPDWIPAFDRSHL